MIAARRALLFALLALVADAAAAQPVIHGSGRPATDERAVSGYHAIAVSVPSHVEVLQGDAEGATITADDNVLPRIRTTVEDGTLRIRFPRGVLVRPRTPIRIVVRARAIDGLTSAGAVTIEAPRLHGDSLAARLAGEGRLVLPQLEYHDIAVHSSGHGHGLLIGRVDAFELHVAGEGEFNAVRLDARRVTVDIAGSAKAVAWARDSLAVRITGAGSVRYFGDPAVTKRIVGAGEVRRLGAAPP